MSPPRTGPGSRRQEILQALAQELERKPGSRITTAALAEALGVTEAALYRHFPSKAKMFEALIAFAEESVFGLVTRILSEQDDAALRCEHILSVLLGFAERNPGISRVLIGDALVGEQPALRARVSQFFQRLETQLKQVLREATLSQGSRPKAPAAATASLLMAVAEGRMVQYLRSGFDARPTDHWQEQWQTLAAGLFTGERAGIVS